MNIAEKSVANASAPRWKLWPRRRKYITDEDGAVTVEFVLWVPIFVLILALTVDASMIFMTQSNMWSVTRDITRHMSTGLNNLDYWTAYAEAEVGVWGKTTTITTAEANGFVTVTLTVPISEVAPFNVVGIFTSGNIATKLTQRVEPSGI